MNTAQDNIRQLLFDQINDNAISPMDILEYASAEDNVLDLIDYTISTLSNEDLSDAIARILADKQATADACKQDKAITDVVEAITDVVEAYDHNLPDALELILRTTFREMLSYDFNDKVLGKMVRECTEAMLEERGYNKDEIADIINT